MDYNVKVADFSPGMNNLFQGVKRRSDYEQIKAAELKRGQEEEAAAVEDQRSRQEVMTALENEDVDEIQSLMIKYPNIRNDLVGAIEYKNDITKQNAIESAVRIITGDDPRDVLAERVGVVKDQGGNIEETVGFAGRIAESKDPEFAVRRAKILLSYLAPDVLKSLQEYESGFTPGMSNTQKEYTQAIKDGSFEGSLLEWQIKAGGKDKTEAIKEYEYGLKNPGFAIKKKAKEDDLKTKEVAKRTYDNSQNLRKEFLSQSSEYIKVRDAYTRVQQSTKEPSAAGDLSLIFNYMKMLDPGSVVRESEFATAAATGSYGERIKAAVQKVFSGERLSDVMRQDFLKKSGELYTGMSTQHKKRERTYSRLAKRNNLPVVDVVVDISQPVLPEGVTEEKMEFTMKKYKMTREQVLQKLSGR